MRQPHLQVGEQRQVGAGPGDLLEVERRLNHGLIEHRAFGQHVAARPRYQAPARKGLASLETHQLCERHVHAVLARHVLDDPTPTRQARRTAGGVLRPADAAGRARAGNDDELRPAQRRQHRGEGVPGILTDQESSAAPPGIERLHRPARFDEPLLVEHAIGREEHFPVHVPDARVGAAERGIEAGVEQPVLVHLVESEGDVERRGLRVAVLAGEVVEQLFGAEGQVAHAALEEIAGEGGLGRHDQLGRLRRRRGLAEDVAEPAEVLLVGTLAGPQLSDGKAEHQRNVYLPNWGNRRLEATSTDGYSWETRGAEWSHVVAFGPHSTDSFAGGSPWRPPHNRTGPGPCKRPGLGRALSHPVECSERGCFEKNYKQPPGKHREP